MFQFIQDLLFVSHGLELISGVKSTVISSLWSTEAIEKVWDMRFNQIVHRYLKHDGPSHIWRTNTWNMTKQPSGEEGPSVKPLWFACLYIHGYKQVHT